MFRNLIFIGLSKILQLINAADENEVGDGESGNNEKNLLNPFASKKSIGASYLTFGGAKRGSGNTKKGVKATSGSNQLIIVAKKAFNYLWHTFTQTFILPYFDLEWYIWIKTNASSYAISRVLN